MNYNEFLNRFIANWKTIVKFSLISLIIYSFILVFVYPITYSSVIKILPPEQNRFKGFSGVLNNPDFFDVFSNGTSGNTSQLFAEMLKSRSAAEYVIEKCNLRNYFNSQNKNEASSKLQKLLNVEVSKEGIISASVDLATPLFSRFSSKRDSIINLSSRISNCYAEALDYLNRQKLNSRARKTSEYLEYQLLSTKLTLDSAEVALKNFQEKNKTISLPEQLTTSIETAAKLKSEIILTEVQLGTMSANLQQSSSIIEGLKTKLTQLNKQYAQIESGAKLDLDYLPDFEKIPNVSLELARLLRDVKIQNEVYLLLQKQYYSEKLQENKNIPTIEILDSAIAPLKAKSPNLFFDMLIGSIIIFILFSLYVVILDKRKSI